jgi:hypothetical protein
MAKTEVKTSLLDNMIGVGDMVLLEPLNEETFINNLKKRFDHNEIYVSMHEGRLWCLDLVLCGRELAFLPQTLLFFSLFLTVQRYLFCLERDLSVG